MAETLPWLAEEIAALVKDAPPSAARYALAVWCGDRPDDPEEAAAEGPWEWVTVAETLSWRGVGLAMRLVRSHGWDRETLYVNREDR